MNLIENKIYQVDHILCYVEQVGRTLTIYIGIKQTNLYMKFPDGITIVDITEDHSLFNSDRVKIKPSEINESTTLEYHSHKISSNLWNLDEIQIDAIIKLIENKTIDKIPLFYLIVLLKTKILR